MTLVFAAIIAAVGTLGYIFSFYSYPTDARAYDCAVVFGAAVWPGGNPSHALSDRTHAAIEAYERGQVSCLVFSGAESAYEKHEIDVMLDIAYEREVELEDVELDYYGVNTRETIRHLDKTRSYLLVSNDFHLARITLAARQLGLMDVRVMKSPYRNARYSRESFFVVREIAAFWYYVFNG